MKNSLQALESHHGISTNEWSDVSFLAHSIGCAAALEYAAHAAELANTESASGLNIGKLLLISPFTSIVEMSSRVLPIPILGLDRLIRHDFDNIRSLSALSVAWTQEQDSESRRRSIPVSIVHGDADNIVPVSMGRSVYQHAKNLPGKALRVRYKEVPRGDHNMILETAMSYIQREMAFSVKT